MRAGAGLLVLGLAGCQSVGSVPPSTGVPGLSLVPAAGGLTVAGSGGREIGFGRDQIGALESITRIEGTAPRTVPCGNGRQAFAAKDDLRLVFAGGTFVGWSTPTETMGRGCA